MTDSHVDTNIRVLVDILKATEESVANAQLQMLVRYQLAGIIVQHVKCVIYRFGSNSASTHVGYKTLTSGM